MFLKTLTIKGFKSFADATTLDLEPGITVIVGPNGSGKSNVVDAVAWVLGAQGPRALRSTKMDDVIFAGTAKRAALGRAEVSLTIDNTDGVLPIGFTEVTITRTLFRNGESEYAINGAPVRLLDVQELLSDSGVGRQQHVIVSQGQLDAVLNARPEDRRTIIEEAAGVLKFRRRRERAQRRLESTEANFVRLGDVLREVRRQLKPLERQASAAKQHELLTAEVKDLRLYVLGREIESLQARSSRGDAQRADLARRDAEHQTTLHELDLAIRASENEISALSTPGSATPSSADGDGDGFGDGFRNVDLGEALARTEAVHQRARGLVALLGERRRGIDRDRQAYLDDDAVGLAETEAAGVRVELERVNADAALLPPELDQVLAGEAALADEREKAAAEWGEELEPARPEIGAAAVQAQISTTRLTIERATHDLDRISGRLRALTERTDRRRIEADAASVELAALENEQTRLGAQDVTSPGTPASPGTRASPGTPGEWSSSVQDPVAQASSRRAELEAALAQAEQRSADAEARFRDADGERRAWLARCEALAHALDEARARAGAERLAGVDGLIGTLLDLVDIDPGWEAAFEAAVGEAMGSVIVRDVTVARQALEKLHAGELTGAVLALGTLGALAPAPPMVVEVGEPVRAHVRSRGVDVERALDALLASAVAVKGTWAEALDVAMAHPRLTVVTLAGDRYSATGWRAGAGSSGATGAALEDATAHGEEAALLAQAAQQDVIVVREAVAAARVLVRDARVAESAAISTRQKAESAAAAARLQAAAARDRVEARITNLHTLLSRIEGEFRDIESEVAGLGTQRAEILARRDSDESRLATLESQLPGLVEAESELAARQARRRDVLQRLDARSQALSAVRRDLEVRAAGIEERRRLLTRRVTETEERVAKTHTQQLHAQSRRRELSVLLRRTDAVEGAVSRRLSVLEAGLSELRELRRRQSEAARAATVRVEQLRRRRQELDGAIADGRDRLQRLEVELAEVRLRLETSVQQLRREFDCEPDVAVTAAAPSLPADTTATARLASLERELRLLGPVNPLALDEFNELQERNALIEAQLEDVKNSRRELAKVIKAIDDEIVNVFSSAFVDVAENFGKLFGLLFPGGQGSLRLTEPSSPLDTGVEVDARPSGKNVKKLSLLSGGERSLTALAFLFAVFRSRPSPFYLMDEVEAALDDVNLHRFLGLLHEFRGEAQLIVVSHQRRTMEAADCLYGVTMQPGGSSKAVSERVSAAR